MTIDQIVALANQGGAAAFSPASVSGYTYDWNGASLSGLSDGATIATWTDGQSSVALVQATEANKPTKETVTFNGKTFIVARFADGTDDLHTGALSALAAMTVYLVMKSADTAMGYLMSFGATTKGIIQAYTATKYEWYDTPRTEIGTISTTNFQTVSTAVGSTSNALGWMLAGNSVVTADAAPGDYARVIVYNRVVTAGEDTSIKAYLSGLYGTA